MPGVVGAPDVVEEPVADVDAGGRVAHARRPPSRPRRRAATAWSTGSRWCRRRRRRGRRPRRARRTRRATRAARSCWTARRPCSPVARSSSNIGRTSGSVSGVRLPELVVGGQQLRVVVEPGLGEEVGDGGALLVVAAAPPDDVAGRCSRSAWAWWSSSATASDDRLGERQRLGVEVDVVPAGQGAAPVEDDRLDAAREPCAVSCARLGDVRDGLRRPATSSRSPVRAVPDLDDAVGQAPADRDDRRHADQLGVLELHAGADLAGAVVVEHVDARRGQSCGEPLGGGEDRLVLAGGDDVDVGGRDVARPAQARCRRGCPRRSPPRRATDRCRRSPW